MRLKIRLVNIDWIAVTLAYRPFESRVVLEFHRRLHVALQFNYAEVVGSDNTAVKWRSLIEEKRWCMQLNQRFQSHNLAKWFWESLSYAKVCVSVKPWMKGWPNHCLDVLQVHVDSKRLVPQRRSKIDWGAMAKIGDVDARSRKKNSEKKNRDYGSKPTLLEHRFEIAGVCRRS